MTNRSSADDMCSVSLWLYEYLRCIKACKDASSRSAKDMHRGGVQ